MWWRLEVREGISTVLFGALVERAVDDAGSDEVTMSVVVSAAILSVSDVAGEMGVVELVANEFLRSCETLSRFCKVLRPCAIVERGLSSSWSASR